MVAENVDYSPVVLHIHRWILSSQTVSCMLEVFALPSKLYLKMGECRYAVRVRKFWILTIFDWTPDLAKHSWRTAKQKVTARGWVTRASYSVYNAVPRPGCACFNQFFLNIFVYYYCTCIYVEFSEGVNPWKNLPIIYCFQCRFCVYLYIIYYRFANFASDFYWDSRKSYMGNICGVTTWEGNKML